MEPKMADSCNVKVAVRCRPSNAEERKGNQPTVITCDSENKSLKISIGPAGKKVSKDYTFDKVFGMYSTQQEVFESIVRPVVEETLAGFNCTIFAYGQTGINQYSVFSKRIKCTEIILKMTIRSIFLSNQTNYD